MNDLITFRKIISYVSIGIFMLVTVVFFTSYTSMKKERATNGRLYVISHFLNKEKKDTNEYPSNLRCFPNHEYRSNILVDGWGNFYHYESINEGKDYVLFSVGKDGIPYTSDDVDAKNLRR